MSSKMDKTVCLFPLIMGILSPPSGKHKIMLEIIISCDILSHEVFWVDFPKDSMIMAILAVAHIIIFSSTIGQEKKENSL